MKIDEKSPNFSRNWGRKPICGYYIFTLLFEVLIAGQSRFCLVALVGLLLSWGIVSWAIKSTVSIKGEIAISLLGLFL